ncbi:MAG: alpha-galactosidase [Terracidiphilus sp.]
MNGTLPRVIKPALVLACACALLCGPGSLAAQAAAKQIAIPLPPMGWSSWNSFSNTVDSEIVAAQAQAMVSSGMRTAGYGQINIDEGWWLGERDAEGNIVVDPKAWPALEPGERDGDMSNIVRYIHGLGLKAGIYTDAGADGCSTVGPDLGPSYPHTGSEGHYEQDFLQFTKWGFDYVKVDWCGGYKENLDPAIQYAEIARAIGRAEAITGHQLYFSICNWGKDSPWSWAPDIGGVTADIWRTGGDIVAPIVAGTKNSGRQAEFKEILREFDQAYHPEAQHTGFYNDPDMMVVGMQGLTDEQSRAHMSLWAILGGPLLVGADLTKLSDATRATLTNSDVLAIDQDPLGLQPVKVSEPGTGLQVWSKPLSAAGQRAVLLLNRTDAPAQIAVNWKELGLIDSSPVAVRDVWAHKDLGTFRSSYSATAPAGDVVLLIVRGADISSASYQPAPATGEADRKSRLVSFTHVASRSHVAVVQITYSNPDKAARFAELRVNGQVATRIAFPPTGNSGALGTIAIEALLDRTGSNNVLAFSSPCGPGPDIESIAVQ